MAEKPAKKTVSIAIKRDRPNPPRTLIAIGFRLRTDKETGLTEILLQASGQRGERIAFDPVVMRTNLEMLKRYAAGLIETEDDAAQKEDIAVGEANTFANMMHFSHNGASRRDDFRGFQLV